MVYHITLCDLTTHTQQYTRASTQWNPTRRSYAKDWEGQRGALQSLCPAAGRLCICSAHDDRWIGSDDQQFQLLHSCCCLPETNGPFLNALLTTCLHAMTPW